MKMNIQYFGEDDQSKELYKLGILVNPEYPNIEKAFPDFQYEHIQDGYIRMVRRGQYLTLLNRIRDFDREGRLQGK